ncbi:MAG TPA: alpha/beta hydrolase [Sphingomonas sp.]|nr:alpha/beta hydrolase [Sphingomonas sp.]
MTSELDPDIRTFHARTSADYARLSGGGYADIAARRAVAETVREGWAAGGPAMAHSETLTVGPFGNRIRIHRPTGEAPLPVMVYLHGGGWMLFSIDSHDRLMREYAARSGCAVIGIDYSLAPEARFPRALDEVEAVLAWLRDHGAAHGVDATRLALGGDSAGGNLALSTALRLRDAGHDAAALLLNYGAFDTVERGSHARYDGDTFMLTRAEMADFWANYLGPSPAAAEHPHARPMLADLHGLPPAFLCIAECDILADENLAMAERLREAGVAVTARVYPGASHSFLEAVEISALADRALAEASRWLGETLC